ncbi:UDP-glycosyltransferase 92A1-like [Coffea eugenioides]|uniref:UDP-glycosyltransferase 92A1-like n=1 Tax=Coffea eugenioides TaxID=49369 RepID=UPI000F60F751|nr:UDP-glycosyltransferase 92A1-like [Coffea eugenioides]
MEARGEILVVPFFGQGHLFPCMELCKHFSSDNYKAILIIPSHLSSSVPSSVRGLSLVEVVEIPNSPSSSPPHPPLPPPSEMTTPPPPALLPELLDGSRPGPGFGPGPGPLRHHHQQMGSGLEAYLSQKCGELGQTRRVCAVLDVMMSWSKEFFVKFEIPTVSFLTSGACSAAMEYAGWKAQVRDMKPGEIRKFDGLPEDMELSYSDLKRQEHHGPHRHGGNVGGPAMDGPNGPPGWRRFGRPDGGNGPPNGMKLGPPGAGSRPRWLDEVEGSSALLFNTCNDLEHPFIKYLADQIDKPVYGVGPLLPEKYWKSSGSILHDGEFRSNRKSNYTEDQVIQWMDSKPHQSVIYVSFGSEVGPSLEEYAELAHALGELNRPFIWVIQPNSGRAGPPPGFMGDESRSQTKEEGFYPHGLEEKVGDRGLVINGWAPQLLILSHPSLGGFLSHCGWNSTVESIARGVPILAWPIRGDQFHNAKLVVKHLKAGHMLRTGDDPKEMVKKDGIIRGIDLLLDDKEVHKQAVAVRSRFKNGFPASSVAALKSFLEAIVKKN